MSKWIAVCTMAVAAVAAPLAAAGQDCDPTTLAVACTHDGAAATGNASFLSIAADAERAQRAFEDPRAGSDANAGAPAAAHPVAYLNEGSTPSASLAVLNAAGGQASGGWLRMPASLSAGPAPALSWLFVLGFLGFIVLRRTRDARAF